MFNEGPSSGRWAFFRMGFQVTQEAMREIGFMNPSLELLKAALAVGRYQFQTKSGGDEIMSSNSCHFQTHTGQWTSYF